MEILVAKISLAYDVSRCLEFSTMLVSLASYNILPAYWPTRVMAKGKMSMIIIVIAVGF